MSYIFYRNAEIISALCALLHCEPKDVVNKVKNILDIVESK